MLDSQKNVLIKNTYSILTLLLMVALFSCQKNDQVVHQQRVSDSNLENPSDSTKSISLEYKNLKNDSEGIRQALESKSSLRFGDEIIETAPLWQLYSRRGFGPIWTNQLGQFIKQQTFDKILILAEQNGLLLSDYKFKDLENEIAKIPNVQPLYLEILLSHAYLKLARNLYQGRLQDPDLVDDDIKYPRKIFNAYGNLSDSLDHGDDQILNALQSLTPQNLTYKGIQTSYKNLLQYRTSAWEKMPFPDKNLSIGESFSSIHELKKRMSLFGYNVSNPNSDVVDLEFIKVLDRFYKLNGQDTSKQLRPSVFKFFNVSVVSRLEQMEIALEKIRWWPQQFESRYISVNLAFQEFVMKDSGVDVLRMRSINGQRIRRTPQMRDVARTVEMNPTWTVPRNLALKDKLPHIKQDPNFLSSHNMKLYNSDGLEVDPRTVDWSKVNSRNFSFTIVQGPGDDNALGRVKFPLTNPWAIYMHDTNERNLFAQSQRLLSSGCVRLQRPFDLAYELLRDQSNYTPSSIQALLALDEYGQIKYPQYRIRIRQEVPVYLTYLTVDVAEDGAIRFADDHYASDWRLKKILQSRQKNSAYQLGTSTSVGELQVIGEAGPAQLHNEVVVSYCAEKLKSNCQSPQSLPLNEVLRLNTGSYMLGFENSIYPGWVNIENGQRTQIQLTKLFVPENLKSAKQIKVYKDLTDRVEQRKTLWMSFFQRASLFRQAQYSFGDLYPATSDQVDVSRRMNYNLCKELPNWARVSKVTEEAIRICRIYNNAKSFIDLSSLFSFRSVNNTDRLQPGSYFQMWMTAPGDQVRVLMRRQLVSAPIRGEDFISVLPGVYRFESENGAASSVSVSTGQIVENY